MNVKVDITVRDENDNIIMTRTNSVFNTTSDVDVIDEHYTVERLDMHLAFLHPIAMKERNNGPTDSSN